MKITLTGGSGFIGRRLLKTLVNARAYRARSEPPRRHQPATGRQALGMGRHERRAAAGRAGWRRRHHPSGRRAGGADGGPRKRSRRSAIRAIAGHPPPGTGAIHDFPAALRCWSRPRQLGFMARAATRRSRNPRRRARAFWPTSARNGRKKPISPSRWACGWSRFALASCWTRTAERWPRCCRPSAISPAAAWHPGKQWMSWIHLQDLAQPVSSRGGESGPGRAQRHRPESGDELREFTKKLAAALKRPALFPVPAIALKAIFGEMSEILTASQRVLPQAAAAAGFRFQYPELGAGAGEIC